MRPSASVAGSFGAGAVSLTSRALGAAAVGDMVNPTEAPRSKQRETARKMVRREANENENEFI